MYNLNALESLSFFKRGALYAGSHGKLLSDFRIQSKLMNTDFTAGQYTEVTMAWMLGYFRFQTGLYLKVDISPYLDRDGIDFILAAGRNTCRINIKFNKPSKSDVADTDDRYDLCVRVWSDPSVTYTPEPAERQTGCEALMSMLCTVYKKRVVSDEFENRHDMALVINDAWKKNTNN